MARSGQRCGCSLPSYLQDLACFCCLLFGLFAPIMVVLMSFLGKLVPDGGTRGRIQKPRTPPCRVQTECVCQEVDAVV